MHRLLFRKKRDERNSSMLFTHRKILLRYLHFYCYLTLQPILFSLNVKKITSSSDQTLEYRKLSLIRDCAIIIRKGGS